MRLLTRRHASGTTVAEPESGDPWQEWAVCVQTLRPVGIARTIEKGEFVPVKSPIVNRFPSYFRRLVEVGT
jgi:hypothetical protein